MEVEAGLVHVERREIGYRKGVGVTDLLRVEEVLLE